MYELSARENSEEPWKSKIEQYVKPWKFWKKRSGLDLWIWENSERNQVNEGLTISQANSFEPNQNLKHESLILAQDERWRRA